MFWGRFVDLDRLTKVIKLWTDDEVDIGIIVSDFREIEGYEGFDFINSNPDIEKAWTKVRNMFFNNTVFWKDTEWNYRYLELLTAAKRHKSLENYYPFTSLGRLRFSIDQDYKKTWSLDLYIVPTMQSKEIGKDLGEFYVSFNDKRMAREVFENVNDALDFYVMKLSDTHPEK
ncbi:MAG: hypothetical protein ABIS36_09710 [Chryseolinea sp.]